LTAVKKKSWSDFESTIGDGPGNVSRPALFHIVFFMPVPLPAKTGAKNMGSPKWVPKVG